MAAFEGRPDAHDYAVMRIGCFSFEDDDDASFRSFVYTLPEASTGTAVRVSFAASVRSVFTDFFTQASTTAADSNVQVQLVDDGDGCFVAVFQTFRPVPRGQLLVLHLDPRALEASTETK